MQVTGKITKVLDIQSGTSKAGKEWEKVSFLIETEDEYNNLYCFDIFGSEKVDKFTKYNKIGDDVDVEFNVKCNEWNGKYFTSLDAWKIFKVKEQAEAPEAETDAGSDDLPF